MSGYPFDTWKLNQPITLMPEVKQIPSFSELFIRSVEFIPVSKIVLNIEAEEFNPGSQAARLADPDTRAEVPGQPPVSKLSYSIEEIHSKLEDFIKSADFLLLEDKLLQTSSRKVKVFKVFNRGKGKKQKSEFVRTEEFKAGQIESWRKARTMEEEKISQKAKETTLKLSLSLEESEKLKRRIKVTLNKLSPSNCEKLQPELASLGKTSRDNLDYLVENIFQKACFEAKYTEMYAKICKYLKKEFDNFLFDGESPSIKSPNWLRYVLLNIVQNTFEDSHASEDLDPQAALVQKKKSHGSVRFIGELLKVRIITAKIIQAIVESLLDLNKRNPHVVDQDKIEVACVMISTAGSTNEKSKLIKETNKIFTFLAEVLHSNQSLSSQVKFRIMDLLDERKSGWVKDLSEQPKHVEELRSEFNSEMDSRGRN